MDSNSLKKHLQNEDFDRISDLPDPILGKILSYLPTRDAVATSILSTRWTNLFPSFVPLTELVFDDSCILHHRANFVNFVDKLLNVTLRDVPCVERVVFNIDNCFDDSLIVSWVRGALRLNVKHLRFVLSVLDDSEALFSSLNGCETLEELVLGKGFHFCFPQEFILPNLKRLSLSELVLCDETYSINGLLGGFPVLNELRITDCYFEVLGTLNIKHPILKKLFIDGCYNETECLVEIDAPNLEAFVYEGPFDAEYVMKNTNSLHLVCIDFDYYSEETDGDVLRHKAYCLFMLVMACSSTTRLCLSGNSMMALYRSSVSLPTFQNLTCLVLGHMGSSGWEMLMQFNKSAPNLTTLTFEEGLEFAGAYVGFRSPFNFPFHLELHVKKIEIWEFKWRPNEIELMEYLLREVKVLQELIIYCLPYENRSELKKLSMLLRRSRHSSACQVLFRDKSNRENIRGSRENCSQFNDTFVNHQKYLRF